MDTDMSLLLHFSYGTECKSSHIDQQKKQSQNRVTVYELKLQAKLLKFVGIF